MRSLLIVMILAAVSAFAVSPSDYTIAMQYMCSNTTARCPTDFRVAQIDGQLVIQWNVQGIPKPTFSDLDAIMPQALAWYDETEDGSKKRIQSSAESNLVALAASVGVTNAPIDWVTLAQVGEQIASTNEMQGLKLKVRVLEQLLFYSMNGGDVRKAGKKTK